MISDLRPRVEQAVWFARQLDVAGESPVIERMATRFLSAAQLAAMVTAALEAQKPLAPRPVRGSLTVAAAGDDSTLLLVAPRDEVEFFRALIEQFDRRGEVRSMSYTPRGLELGQVRQLLEQTARDLGPGGSGDRWKIVEDAISGTLIVTATPGEREQIKTAMERLAQLPPQARLPVRTFPIRNRSVEDIVQLLQELVSVGVLAADTAFAPDQAFDAAAASQTTFRDVLPAGAVSVSGDLPWTSTPGLPIGCAACGIHAASD